MLSDALYILGYSPEDDSWDTDGRRTYSHEENPNADYVRFLRPILGRCGYDLDKRELRRFRHFASREVIELEPVGECDGHYLHHFKAEVADA